jgi:hypothetical protein
MEVALHPPVMPASQGQAVRAVTYMAVTYIDIATSEQIPINSVLRSLSFPPRWLPTTHPCLRQAICDDLIAVGLVRDAHTSRIRS